MGTSAINVSVLSPSEDHPHAYGDKPAVFVCVVPFAGSSPRVWGQDAEGVSQLVALGIIPTRMGTSYY